MSEVIHTTRSDRTAGPTASPLLRLGDRPLIRAIAIFLALLSVYFLWEAIFDSMAAARSHLWTGPIPRVPTAVMLLIAFIHTTGRHERFAWARDIAELAEQLHASPEETRAFTRAEIAPASRILAGAIGVSIGILIVTTSGSGAPYLLSDAPWSHQVVWGLLMNALLFWMLGNRAVESWRTNRLYREIARRLPTIDLLDLGGLEAFAHRGLRVAFMWIGGSAIASLIFIDLDNPLGTALVIAATASLGLALFLSPLRGIHARIREAKQDELRRIRDAMTIARDRLLDPPESGAAGVGAPLADLIAYEARIDSVRAWPIDLSTLARFSVLVIFAVGSWLGGAIVERLLGLALD